MGIVSVKLFSVKTRRAGGPKIRLMPTSLVVPWRGAGAPRGKATIFHYGVKGLEQNKIVFASTVIIIFQNSADFAKHSISRVEETFATLFCVMTA